MAALLKRASELGAITERNARYTWMQLGKAGYRMREPAYLDIPVEQPSLLQDMVELHTTKLGYTSVELARVVNLNDHEVRSTYLKTKPAQLKSRQLRAVRSPSDV